MQPNRFRVERFYHHQFLRNFSTKIIIIVRTILMVFFSFSFSRFTASRIRYEITSGNIGGAFAVKNMTGAIYVAGALDYETRKRVSTRSVEYPKK